MKFGVKSDGSFEQVIHPGVKYVLLATCEGFMNYRQELEIDSSEVSTCDTLFFPLPSLTSPVLVRNVFYEFDSATLTDNSKEALDNLTRLLQENPNITIELSSHCDYRGNELYNRKLSQRRAESVVDYLIKQGISPQRLSAVGYGKLRPKVVTKRLAEVYDFLHEGDTLTEQYILKLKPIEQDTCNALNRRTEFRVLRTTYGLFDEQGNLDAKGISREQKRNSRHPKGQKADSNRLHSYSRGSSRGRRQDCRQHEGYAQKRQQTCAESCRHRQHRQGKSNFHQAGIHTRQSRYGCR